MGLAQQKFKQRITADPQNNHWKNATENFGFKMLQKMGWSDGKGLGTNEDGNTSHIKIKFKDDSLGIGATKRTVDNWLDNSNAFDALLQNLNGSSSTSDDPQPKTSPEIVSTPINRHSHRKKFLLNKRLASADSKAMNDILGIPTLSKTPKTPKITTNHQEAHSQADEKLQVKKQSVQEYFASMNSSKSKLIQSAVTCDASSDSALDEDDWDARPMMGLGLVSPPIDDNKSDSLIIEKSQKLKKNKKEKREKKDKNIKKEKKDKKRMRI